MGVATQDDTLETIMFDSARTSMKTEFPIARGRQAFSSKATKILNPLMVLQLKSVEKIKTVKAQTKTKKSSDC